MRNLIFFLVAAANLATASPIHIKARSSAAERVNYINFLNNWELSVPNPDLDATDRIVVYYDLDRILPLCNATINTPNTLVTAFYQIRGQTTSTVLLDTHPTPILQNDNFAIPSLTGPGDLAMWFSCATDGSAPKFDSNMGKNYHFNIDGAMLYFAQDFTTITTGKLLEGDPILVQYDITRMSKMCPTDDMHFDLAITGYYKFNNSPITQFPVYYQGYAFHAGPLHEYSEAVITSAITVPGQLSIWFSCQSGLGSGWDSNFGKNWNFQIAQA
ncbi:hypothetical protein HDU76_013119 [Blyttiomyces sp. JEL0837]|nr:hypothetical protein HDU76_013119 [Blyttiomyces sp. JEL0837]